MTDTARPDNHQSHNMSDYAATYATYQPEVPEFFNFAYDICRAPASVGASVETSWATSKCSARPDRGVEERLRSIPYHGIEAANLR